MDLAFADSICGYFEFPTDNARRLLPAHLEPFEVHHGSSILVITVFDLPSSPVIVWAMAMLGILVHQTARNSVARAPFPLE